MSATTLAPAQAGDAAVEPVPPAARRRQWGPPGLDFLFSAVFAMFGFGVGIERLSDNSFFIHLQTGRYILDHGIPHHDIYSYTAPGTKWVAQSWLAEVVYALLDRGFGPFGIRVAMAITGAAITVLAFRLALRLARDRVRAALVTIAALGGLYTLWSERPLLFGVLFFMVLLWVVEVPDCWVGRHPMIVMPVLFWLWANVHGTFALGFAFLGLHLVGRWLDGARPWAGRERTLLTGGAIAFAVIFVNPYGPALVLFPIQLLQRGAILRHVVEWASPDFHHVRGMAFLLWIAVFVGAAARGHNRMSRRDVVVCVPFIGLGAWALRNVALAPLACLPAVARAIAVDPDVAQERRSAEERSPLGWVLAGVLALIVGGMFMRALAQPDFVTDSYPVAAMKAVDHAHLLGKRLLVDDADAAYVVLGYWPQQKVFMDDRYDMYPTSVIYDFFALSDGGPRWKRILDRYDVEVVVWGRDLPLTQYMEQSGDWTRIHRDKTNVVLVRNDVLRGA